MTIDSFTEAVCAELGCDAESLTHVDFEQAFSHGRCPIDFAQELIGNA